MNVQHTKGASYVEINGQFVSAGKAKSMQRQPVAKLEGAKRERDPVQTLASSAQNKRGRSRGVAKVIVSITSYRKRELDSDNYISGCKPLRDAIARTLGIDDGDKRIKFEYHQVITKGAEGTLVAIQAK